MRLSNGLREFLESLNSHGIDYVIVGAHSLAFHARPRYTGDLENAAKLVDLLDQFGFADAGFKESDFTEPDQLIQLGRAPNRIDLLTSITGVTTDEALASKVSADLDGIPVFILAKDAPYTKQACRGPPTRHRRSQSTG